MAKDTRYNKEAFSSFVSNLRKLMDGEITGKKETMEQLAEKIGVQRQTISKYRSGDRDPDYKTALKIAEHYNVSLDWLVGRHGASTRIDPKIQEVMKYIGLSESAIEKLHIIHEKLEESRKSKCSISEINRFGDNSLIAKMKIRDHEVPAEMYIKDIYMLECSMCFINALINSEALTKVSLYSSIAEIGRINGLYAIQMPIENEKILEYGRQHYCMEKINEVAHEVKALGREQAFPYLTQLEKKRDTAEEKYNREHPGNKQRII